MGLQQPLHGLGRRGPRSYPVGNPLMVQLNLSRLGHRWSYDFKVRIKAIPDVAINKGLFSWMLP